MSKSLQPTANASILSSPFAKQETRLKRLIFQGPGQVVLEPLDDMRPGSGEVTLRTLVSSISAGTESLLWRGLWPQGVPIDSVWASENQAVYPVAYGYASVGRIESVGEGVDPVCIGRLAFVFSPHQTHILARRDAIWLLPEDLSPENGVFLAAMETALSLAQDAAPVRGELVGVWGLGTVGLLTSRLLADQVLAWDVLANRRAAAENWGIRVERPAPASCDAVLELTGNPSALNEALQAVRFGGRLVLGSWYGARPVEVALGGDFHRSRIEMLSSQVSTISPKLSGRWTKKRRLETALRLVAELGPEALVTHRFPIAEAARAYEQACDHPEKGLQVLLTY